MAQENISKSIDIVKDLKFVPLSTEPIRYFPKAHIDESSLIVSEAAIVGVFDFLGFKKFMSRPNLYEIYSELIGISNLVKRCGEDCERRFKINGKISEISAQTVQISDTIIVYSMLREPQNIKHFLYNAHCMMFYAILAGHPLRGALSTGKLLINKDPVLLLGGALEEAFEFEKRQIWSGACICPSLQQYLNEIELLDGLSPLILPYSIPFKNEESKYGEMLPRFALNWIDEFNWISPDHIIKKFQPFDSGSHEEKIFANNKKFLKFATDQIAKCEMDWGPINRKIVFEQAPDLGGNIIRIVDGKDD